MAGKSLSEAFTGKVVAYEEFRNNFETAYKSSLSAEERAPETWHSVKRSANLMGWLTAKFGITSEVEQDFRRANPDGTTGIWRDDSGEGYISAESLQKLDELGTQILEEPEDWWKGVDLAPLHAQSDALIASALSASTDYRPQASSGALKPQKVRI